MGHRLSQAVPLLLFDRLRIRALRSLGRPAGWDRSENLLCSTESEAWAGQGPMLLQTERRRKIQSSHGFLRPSSGCSLQRDNPHAPHPHIRGVGWCLRHRNLVTIQNVVDYRDELPLMNNGFATSQVADLTVESWRRLRKLLAPPWW